MASNIAANQAAYPMAVPSYPVPSAPLFDGTPSNATSVPAVPQKSAPWNIYKKIAWIYDATTAVAPLILTFNPHAVAAGAAGTAVTLIKEGLFNQNADCLERLSREHMNRNSTTEKLSHLGKTFFVGLAALSFITTSASDKLPALLIQNSAAFMIGYCGPDALRMTAARVANLINPRADGQPSAL